MAQFLFLNRVQYSSIFLTASPCKPLKLQCFLSVWRVFIKTLDRTWSKKIKRNSQNVNRFAL